jgi:hypothetical protein
MAESRERGEEGRRGSGESMSSIWQSTTEVCTVGSTCNFRRKSQNVSYQLVRSSPHKMACQRQHFVWLFPVFSGTLRCRHFLWA